MNNWTASQASAIAEIKDVDLELANRVRLVWKASTQGELETLYPQVSEFIAQQYHTPPRRQQKRWIIDRLIGACGVEHLGLHKRRGNHVYYCNAGDTYATTIIFIGRQLKVGCWGDLVERNLIQEPEQP